MTLEGTCKFAGKNKTQDICFIFIDGAQEHKTKHK
jgi:hypothetical protein